MMSSEPRLVIAVLHEENGEEVLKALLEAKYRVTRIASTGGFLRRGTATLLIGVDKSRVQAALQLIRENSAPVIDPGLKRAHVFVLKVDHFEQLNQGNL